MNSNSEQAISKNTAQRNKNIEITFLKYLKSKENRMRIWLTDFQKEKIVYKKIKKRKCANFKTGKFLREESE